MRLTDDLPADDRIHELARRADHERSLYIGEAIGHMLVIAWDALGSIGNWLRRPRAARRAS
jgi:predicted transcriptional regulator